MTAATQDIALRRKCAAHRKVHYPVGIDIIYANTLVAIDRDDGYLYPAQKNLAHQVIGVAMEKVDNSGGSAGDLSCEVGTGVYWFEDSAAAITQADLGKVAWCVDDQTISDSGETGNKVPVGRVTEIVGSSGAFVEVGLHDYSESHTAVETVTSGAISIYTKHSDISVTGTAAYTLANGRYDGQRKSLFCSVAASTPDGTITPALFAYATSIDFDAVVESCVLEWHVTTGWHLISIVGAGTA